MNNSHRHQPWADLAIFENFTDGQTLTQQLKDQGFEARAYDDKAFRYFLFLRPPQITYRVQVHQDDVTPATAFLTTKSPVVLAKAIHCELPANDPPVHPAHRAAASRHHLPHHPS
jgi:hypothetical protein